MTDQPVYSFVVAFRCSGLPRAGMDLWLVDLRSSVRGWGERHAEGFEGLDVAVSELPEGKPKGKVTRGEWGGNGR